ncbi:endonuclease NucS domain-containing protein [Nocardia inohanensis]|uniref:endonuclease NucS domain-containing protein n=1 Tax=Nocardia inohanensis TaxID=209246 RepID=UPI000A06E486|nr:endonuclease NucS domain-containing protein [Nocardia inohanensis]
MQPPSEHQLRRHLVQNLHLIEPGLRPAQLEEFRLSNANGTRGSIDILARDRHNMWVVIELKRSKTTSRQALHEVTKYTELLCRENHLAPDRIRTIIVSTDWSELLVPVSNMARDWNHDLRGYQLVVDQTGTPISANRVRLLAEAFESRITPIHIMYFFKSENDRADAWSRLAKEARNIGAEDLLGVEFDRIAAPDNIPNHFGLYLAIGRINTSIASPIILRGYDGPEPFAAEYPVEYLTLCHLCNYIADLYHRYNNITESAYPGLLGNISSDKNWKLQRYLGSGAFSNTDAYEEDDLYQFLTGEDRGDNQVQFRGAASPALKTRWKSFLAEVEGSLVGNTDWTLLVNEWLKEAEIDTDEGTVAIQVYNPCDLLGGLVYGWPNKMDNFLPSIIGFAEIGSDKVRYIRGTLIWNGWGRDILDAFQLTYRDTIEWHIHNISGVGWVKDEILLRHLGLKYVLLETIGQNPFEFSPANEQRIWLIEDGVPQSYSSSREPTAYRQIMEYITPRGKLFTANMFLNRYSTSVDLVASQYRYPISGM